MTAALKIVGLGAGGHARALVEILEGEPGRQIIGYLDPDPARAGQNWCGYPILGSDTLLAELGKLGVKGFFLGLGAVGVPERRKIVYGEACRNGLEPVSVVHPSALISKSATIGLGFSALARVVVNPAALIGENVCLNSGTIIEHDCRIGDHVFVAPGVLLSGGVEVGSASFVGIGAVVRQGVRIGAHSIVGAGAVVIRDVDNGSIVAGVPARPLGPR
jgi:UDP-perosamine 4-acetyltransferase